ncbi:MAG: DNA-binding protein [Eubacterium sp.]|nr:DNA-binding protein [Eubacterium sp.]
MDERLRQTLLYDFYGELLNEHQKNVYSAAIFDDMSYSELSNEFGCSRQAAFDLIRRIDKKLENFEARLGLLARFMDAREKMDSLSESILSVKQGISESDLSKEDKKKIDKELSGILDITREVFDEF